MVLPGKASRPDLRHAAIGHEDVGGLDVAVDDALGVRRFQRIGQLRTEIEDAIERERSPHEKVPKGVAPEQFHHDEGLSVVLCQVVDSADVRMIERRCGTRLPPKAGQRNIQPCREHTPDCIG